MSNNISHAIISQDGFKYSCKHGQISSNVSCGLYVYLGVNGLYGYCDLQNSVVIDSKYNHASLFDSVTGTAIVEKQGLQFLIDTRGNILTPVGIEIIHFPRCGRVAFKADGTYKYLNSDYTKIVSLESFWAVNDYYCGLAAVMPVGTNKIYYINLEGDRTLGPYSERTLLCCDFQPGGIAIIKQGDYEYFSMNTSGTVLGRFLCRDINPFASFASPMTRRDDNLTQYVRFDGSTAFNGLYEIGKDFINGYAVVSRDNFYWLIDTTGNEIANTKSRNKIVYYGNGTLTYYDSNNKLWYHKIGSNESHKYIYATEFKNGFSYVRY